MIRNSEHQNGRHSNDSWIPSTLSPHPTGPFIDGKIFILCQDATAGKQSIQGKSANDSGSDRIIDEKCT